MASEAAEEGKKPKWERLAERKEVVGGGGDKGKRGYLGRGEMGGRFSLLLEDEEGGGDIEGLLFLIEDVGLKPTVWRGFEGDVGGSDDGKRADDRV